MARGQHITTRLKHNLESSKRIHDHMCRLGTIIHKFANDFALYASSHDGFQEFAFSFICVARGWGLTVNLIKSKGMLAEIGANMHFCFVSNHNKRGAVDLVENFHYH